jgi:hypothetical protein
LLQIKSRLQLESIQREIELIRFSQPCNQPKRVRTGDTTPFSHSSLASSTHLHRCRVQLHPHTARSQSTTRIDTFFHRRFSILVVLSRTTGFHDPKISCRRPSFANSYLRPLNKGWTIENPYTAVLDVQKVKDHGQNAPSIPRTVRRLDKSPSKTDRKAARFSSSSQNERVEGSSREKPAGIHTRRSKIFIATGKNPRVFVPAGMREFPLISTRVYCYRPRCSARSPPVDI